ncbi:hypothetical protein N9C83_04010 [Opitutales bacterium]|nr:hypothetical protein [Opitutales bacterium]
MRATCLLAFCLSASAQNQVSEGLVQIHCDNPAGPPAWALYERQLIKALDEAAIVFYDQYVDENGMLTFKERYESGMNSSDDMYEAFRGFSLHTALGGSHEIDKLNRMAWEGITKQFTRYGQIYREFDSNWDWMHHGEGYINFYPMGMVQPYNEKFLDRAVRFAAMYIGEDPEAQNWDPELKQMRAVMTGSRGPLLEWNKRDWTPTNANLTYYPLPFLDIPGIGSSTAWINDHPDNDQFAALVKAMSDRMAKGDVPINMISTPLIASAYMYTGDEKYVEWTTDYLTTWEKLTKRNNGIIPDNVGISGEIGEHTGHWWGGYYGWVWPSGTHIMKTLVLSGKVATLLSGDTRWMNLARDQIGVLRENGFIENGAAFAESELRKRNVSEESIEKIRRGTSLVPWRHDHRGWYHYREENPELYLHLWYTSQSEEDWQHIERLAEAQKKSKGRITDSDLEWAYFVKGLNPGYAERAFKNDLETIARKVEAIQGEQGYSETWVDNKWINMNPMVTRNLNRFSIGGIPIDTRGEMLHSQLRYFDGESKRSGLPKDVATLVTRIEPDWIEVEIVNLNQIESRSLIVQGGTYGEHRIQSVDYTKANEKQSPVENPSPRESFNDQADTKGSKEIDGIAFTVNLEPATASTLRIYLDRYSNKPSYAFPWDR